MAYNSMINTQAPYGGLANLMAMADKNPNTQLAYIPYKDIATRYQTMPNPSTGIPQAMGMSALAGGGDVSDKVSDVASYGRYGDTMLMHVNPKEVRGLSSLGILTTNPDTGLPEAFLPMILPAIMGIGGSALLGGTIASTLGVSALAGGAIAGGLGTTLGGLLSGQKPGEALLSGVLGGAMSYGLGNVMSSLGSGATGTVDATGLGNAGQAAASAPAVNYAGSATIQPMQSGINVGTTLTPEALQAIQAANTQTGLAASGISSASSAAANAGMPSIMPSEVLPQQAIATTQPSMFDKLLTGGKELAKDPTTYGPIGASLLTGLTKEEEEVKKPEGTTEFPEYKFAMTRTRNEPRTQAEILQGALKGRKPEDAKFFDTKFTKLPSTFRNKEGDIVEPEKPSKQPIEYDEDGNPIFSPTGTAFASQGGLIALANGGMPMMPQQQPPMPQPQQPPMPPDITQQFITIKDAQENAMNQSRATSLAGLAGGIMQGSQMMPMNEGGQPYFEGQVQGPGDGQSDQIAFRVAGGNVDGAMLSPDEYVLAADVVSAIGNGSSDAGAAKLDSFMKNVRQNAYGTTQQMQPFNMQGLQSLVA